MEDDWHEHLRKKIRAMLGLDDNGNSGTRNEGVQTVMRINNATGQFEPAVINHAGNVDRTINAVNAQDPKYSKTQGYSLYHRAIAQDLKEQGASESHIKRHNDLADEYDKNYVYMLNGEPRDFFKGVNNSEDDSDIDGMHELAYAGSQSAMNHETKPEDLDAKPIKVLTDRQIDKNENGDYNHLYEPKKPKTKSKGKKLN